LGWRARRGQRKRSRMMTRFLTGRNQIILVGVAALAAFGLGAFTLALLLGVAPIVPATPANVVMCLNANLVVVAVLALMIGFKTWSVFRRRRRGGRGARLHRRIAILFGLVATAPSIMLVIFSIAFLHVGLEQWFGEKVEAAVGRSVSIARAYMREYRLGLARDTEALGALVSAPGFGADATAADGVAVDPALVAAAGRFGFAEAVVFDETGAVRAKAGDVSDLRDAIVPSWALGSAKADVAPVIITGGRERMRALLWMASIEHYLLVGRAIEPGVFQHVEGVNRAVGAYKNAISERTTIEARLSIMYLLLGLVFVLSSVWAGLMFAGALAEPISNLIQTADRVRAGDLSARVPVLERGDEIGSLLVGFNRMTTQLETQRDELIAANAEMDERRRFTAAVLSGVTSGVIGLDEDGFIRAANRYAETTLDAEPGVLVGQHLAEAAPELAEAAARVGGTFETEARFVRGGRQRVLLVRTAAGGAEHDGQVITFTDIADLLAAKRQAAWSGVARRVAHEIKNPLTPIQLAAERLKRRYGKLAPADDEVFKLCCDTIVRQVAALRRMVDEFSDFARLPAPAMQQSDLEALCQEVLFLLRMQFKTVGFRLVVETPDTMLACDPGQITRALNNVLINAVHSVADRADKDASAPPEVVLTLKRDSEHLVVLIEDNGDGFPENILENVAEPYVTTKPDGSGLGLAIVQRIVEDHGGGLSIRNRAESGAAVELRLLALGDVQLAEAGE